MTAEGELEATLFNLIGDEVTKIALSALAVVDPSLLAHYALDRGGLEAVAAAHPTPDGRRWTVHSGTSLHMNDQAVYRIIDPSEVRRSPGSITTEDDVEKPLTVQSLNFPALPSGSQALDGILLARVMREDGSLAWVFRFTDQCPPFEALGALEALVSVQLSSIEARFFEDAPAVIDDDDEDDGT